VGTLVVDRSAEDVVEIELRGAPGGLGRAAGVVTAVALGGLAWALFKGALRRPLLPLVLLAAAGVAAFVLLGWPQVAAWVTRSRIRLDRRRWTVERWVFGVRWRRLEGATDELRGVDPNVAQPGGRHGLALLTTRRGVLVSAHLDATTRARVAELIDAFLARRPLT